MTQDKPIEHTDGTEDVMRWQDIARSGKCNAHREDEAKEIIRSTFGYLPQDHVCMPHLAFMQTLVENHRSGNMPDETFEKEIVFHLLRLRNDDMKPWVRFMTQPPHVREDYKSYLPEYAQKARNRLSKLLGYEPDVEHSMCAELMLRMLYQYVEILEIRENTDFDFKAFMVAKYRETYFKEGADAANELGLPGIEYQEPIRYLMDKI